MSKTKLKESMRIGPKGQVVIPKIFRKALGFHPGSAVVFELRGGNLVLEKPGAGTEEIFEKVAHAGKSVDSIHPHDSYEQEMEERGKKPARRGK